MMKSEFIDLLIDLHEGESIIPNVSDDYYRIIETVYTYYPEFGNKEEAAVLFDTYGMRIFKDMYPRAAQVRSCEERVEKIRRELEEALQVRSCEERVEKIRRELEEALQELKEAKS